MANIKLLKIQEIIIAIKECPTSLFSKYLYSNLYFLNKKINPPITTGKITTKNVNLTPHPKPIKIEDKSKFFIIFLSSVQYKIEIITKPYQ